MKRLSVISLVVLFACFFPAAATLLAQDPLGEDSVSSAASARDQRQPPPSVEERRSSLAKVQEVFAENYASAKTPNAKAELARALFEEAKSTKDIADRWCLLNETMRLAGESGEVTLTLSAVNATASSFRIDAKELRVDALTALAAKSNTKSAEEIAREALRIARSQSQPEASGSDSKLMSLAASMARKSQNRELISQVLKVQAEAKDREKADKEYEATLSKLEHSPNDPEVNLEVGSYLCFRVGDWKQGMPLLAKGSDPELSQLCRAEVSMGDSTNSILLVADGWANWGNSKKAWIKEGAEAHAYELYGRILEKLEGLDRTRVQKRMAALSDASPAVGRTKFGPKSIPGLILWLDASEPGGATTQRAKSDNRLQRWQDYSGNGNDAAQPEEAKRPRRTPNAVEFDGNTFMVVPKPLGLSSFTLVAAYKATANTADSALASTRTKSSSGWLLDHQGGGLYFRVFGEGKAAEARITPKTAEGSRICIATASDSGDITLQLAGGEQVVATTKVIPAGSPTPLHIGAKTGDSGGTNFRGSLCRLILYRRVITASERESLLKWIESTSP